MPIPNFLALEIVVKIQLTMNHPFMDGNKRTALAVMDTFLRVNDCQSNLSNEDIYNLVLKVATQQLNKQNLIAYLKDKIVPKQNCYKE